MDDEFQEFIQIFREESLERLANVSRALDVLTDLDDPRADGAEALEEVDREFHTIKGSARLLGFAELGDLVHRLEDLVRAWRERPELPLELLVEASDRLAGLVEQASDEGQDQNDPRLLTRVQALLAGQPDPGAAEPPTEPAREPNLETDTLSPAELAAQALGLSTPPPPPGQALDSELGELPDPGPALGVSGDEGTDAETEGESESEDSGRSRRVSALGGDELIRVRSSRLADLDGIAGHLSLAHLRFQAYEQELRRLLHSVASGISNSAEVAQTLRNVLKDYDGDALQVRRSAQSLQRLAVDVRLRPVEALFDRIPREARALARSLVKKVRVKLRGADTEIDRVILDRLQSPFSHLVRNAVDHGIESPAERTAAGKPPQGTLLVSAGQEGGQVVIRLEDDGGGIDPAKLRALAQERNVLEPALLAAMSDEEALQLVFVPGLSTRQVTSQISGRGVGMDVVRDAVESLGGEVLIESWLGRGTRTTIRLPLTQLVARVTFLRSGGQQFAVATEALQESLRVPKDMVARFGDHDALVLDERSVPLVRLSALLGQRVLPDPDPLAVLLVRHADGLLALVIEELLEERSVVVKPLGWPLEEFPGFSGAIHLPSGEVALLLHPPDLFALARGGSLPTDHSSGPDRQTVLVVDDSIVSRQLVGRCVEALGFDLITAVDGLDAWSILERVQPDLVVTDLEMPRLGGLALARRLRSDERFQAVPVVIVSTRGSALDRQAGLDAGADAYLTKAELNEKSMRAIVERLL